MGSMAQDYYAFGYDNNWKGRPGIMKYGGIIPSNNVINEFSFEKDPSCGEYDIVGKKYNHKNVIQISLYNNSELI